jgi:hypothetical protein
VNDFPRTVLELRDQSRDGAACREYLARLRWPNGFVCPRCQSRDAWVTARRLYHCRDCAHQASVTAGTLFADTNLPLRLWFEAVWHVTNQKYGASALGMQRILGWVGITLLGTGCTSCGERWCDRVATGWRAW